jgi:hypothetical protein
VLVLTGPGPDQRAHPRAWSPRGGSLRLDPEANAEGVPPACAAIVLALGFSSSVVRVLVRYPECSRTWPASGRASEAMEGHRFVQSEKPMMEERFPFTRLGRPQPVSG